MTQIYKVNTATYLIVREALTLIPYEAAEERHWDEAEEDDEEDRPADDTLRLWTVKNRKRDERVICYHLPSRYRPCLCSPRTFATSKFRRNITGIGTGRMTHTSFLTVLLRSFPYSLAAMKCSLKAGMSVSVAKQPTADIKQLITSVRTGIGDTLSCILTSHCLSIRITLSANLTLPPPQPTIDARATAALTGLKRCKASFQHRSSPQALPQSAAGNSTSEKRKPRHLSSQTIYDTNC